MTLEKRQAPTDRFYPGREVQLVVVAVTIFNRVLEFVERRRFRVEELSIAVEKPVVDDTVQTAPLRLAGGPNGPLGPSTLPANPPRISRPFGSATAAGLDTLSHGEPPFVDRLAGNRAG